MILLCSCPRHLAPGELADSLERSVAALAGHADVTRVRMTELASASLRWARMFDWMIEAELAGTADPRDVVASPEWREALADLRLLGMRPSLAVADNESSTLLGPDR
jgi:hypothetical protein